LHCKLGPPCSAACWSVPAAQSACVLTKYNHIQPTAAAVAVIHYYESNGSAASGQQFR
jgi:hypothetical protein